MIELEIQDELDSWFQIISSHEHYFLLKYMLGRQFPPYLKEKKSAFFSGFTAKILFSGFRKLNGR